MKKAPFHRLMRILSGRLARNIYFWSLMVYMRLEVRPITPLKAWLSLWLFGLLALLFYSNNLLLIPRLLARKKYLHYLLSYAALVLVVSLLYTGTLKVVLHYHPDINAWMISALTASSETPELSLLSLLRETISYYFILGFAGWVFAMSWYMMQYWQLTRKMDEIRRQHLQTELAFLKNQINPHFLFNTLNNLYMLTLRKSDKAPQVVEGLSAIMRYFLQEANAETVSVEKEKETMEAYIAVELLRFTNTEGLRFVIETDKHYSVPPLLWVPVLENMFKHGTRFISDRYDAEFRFSIQDDRMRIYSKNTFKQHNGTATEPGGTGLTNLRKRLQLLYPDRHQLTAKAQGSYFITELNIRLNGTH